MSRLREVLAALTADVTSGQASAEQEQQISQALIRDEEALRAEARGLTFEVSELEARLDAALSMRRSRALSGSRSRGHSCKAAGASPATPRARNASLR